MSLLDFLRPGPPVLSGEMVVLRGPRMRDHREWAELRRQSREFLEPWEPSWGPHEFERSSWRHRIRSYRREYARGTGAAFLIVERGQGQIVGGISMGNIRRGVSQSAQIGYWMGQAFSGRGYMRAAIALILEHGFRSMRLNRIEAACIPENERSIRVLEKAGFRREGLLRSYLRINGVWQDHFLYAMTAEDYGRGRSLGR